LVYEGQSIAGRPGWHIECSAMIHKEFGGQKLDIHCGGQDLVFPHHENEIAQSEACHGEGRFVSYWMHNGFVNVNGEKMSKSLGNFSTVRELLKRYSVNAVRYFIFSHHYRMPVDFSDDALQAAETWAGKLNEALRRAKTSGLLGDLPEVSTALTAVLANDLDTPACLSELNKQMKALNSAIDQSQAEKATLLFSKLQANLGLLGFSGDVAATQEAEINLTIEGYSVTNESIPVLLEERKQAKLSKDWAKADQLRKVLEQAGLELKDNRDGSTSWVLK
jgi:cysteinyl-tRNA synthetase